MVVKKKKKMKQFIDDEERRKLNFEGKLQKVDRNEFEDTFQLKMYMIRAKERTLKVIWQRNGGRSAS